MTEAEKREAARQIYNKWKSRGKEDEDDRSFWLDILTRLFGVPDATDRIDFQKKVIGADGNTKRIDCYIPDTKVLIEQKSRGIALDKAQPGHNNMTPFEQAKMYDNALPHSEKSRWILISNFAEIWIYDMDQKKPEPVKIALDELPSKYTLLEFLISEEVKKVNREMELSLEAGKLVGKIHDRFLEQYNNPMATRTQHSLNILCVRLVFCLYAEDAGLFGASKDAFSSYLQQYEPKDMRMALLNLFKVLDTPLDQRAELYLDDELEAFPYVNGGLFARENIEIPKLTQEIKDTLVESSAFDWSEISPTIFGAVFESTLNPETRRSGGMHYTSIENIHKVIDPLFLDDLKAELAEIKAIKVDRTRDRQLRAFQDKLAIMKWLDPACGSGNFLTETYMSIRRLENEVLEALNHGQIMFGFDAVNPIKVGIDQFYGIEINDFAVTVAKTALWIAESQMMKETEDVVHMDLDFLPLKTNAYIFEGNALRMDWNKVVRKEELSYIMGNPPFVGPKFMSASQRSDMDNIFATVKNKGIIDYVGAWYAKGAEYIKGTKVRMAFVSTNSITQGEQVAPLWEFVISKGIKIDFSYKSFKWESEASKKAAVYCVIIGMSFISTSTTKYIYDESEKKEVSMINPYLIEAPNIWIYKRNKPICNVPKIGIGNKPIDGGYYLFKEQEMKEFIRNEPLSEKYFKKWIGADEFLYNYYRYVLLAMNIPNSEFSKMPKVRERIQLVSEYRRNSKSAPTKKLAETPTRFHVENFPQKHYIVIPEVTGGNRRYIPMGFVAPDIISSNLVKILDNANLYMFGVLESNVHMSWMRAIGSYMSTSYRYSAGVVYNNFPWPSPTDAQKKAIENAAQGILDARAKYPDSSLADLYDPLTMPKELRTAHSRNDKAVMQAYGFDVKTTSEADCVARLMVMYQELSANIKK